MPNPSPSFTPGANGSTVTTSEERPVTVAAGVTEAARPFSGRDMWLGIGAATATISVVGIGLSFGMPLLALILEDRGVPGWIIGANTAVSGIASLLVTPIVPRLTMIVGAARLAIVMVLVSAATFSLFYVFDSLWVWFPLRFVFFGAITALFIVSEYWINALAPEARRGLIMGIYATVLYIGFAAGPLLLGVVGTETALPFILCTAILLLAVVPVFAAMRVSPETEGHASPAFWPFLFAVPMATLAALVFGAAESSGMGFLAIYGERLGFQEATALSFVTALAIGGILFQVPIGLIADRMDRRHLLVGCALAGAIGFAVLPLFSFGAVPLFILILLAGGITGGLYTVGLTYLGSRYRGAELASANAAFIFMYALGMLFGPAASGLAIDAVDPHGLAFAIALFFAVYFFIGVVRLRTPRPRVRQSVDNSRP